MEVESSRRQRKRRKADDVHAANGQAGEEDKDGEGNEQLSESDKEEERQLQIASRTKQLNLVFQILDLLDRIWPAVLRGNLIDLPVALSNARKAYPESTDAVPGDDASSSVQPHPYRPRNVHSTSSLVPSPAIDGRFVSDTLSATNSTKRDSLPVHGGRGNRTVGVTDQVRLRNIAISSREKLFAWMRTELDAPAPPIMDEHDPDAEPKDNTVEGALDVKQDPDPTADAAQDKGDPDMEDVDVDRPQVIAEGYHEEDDTQEHRHYQDLFDRKLDPDADDDGPVAPLGGADEKGSDQKLGASVLGTVEAVTSYEAHEKRKRDDDANDQTEQEEPRADGLPTKRTRADDTDADQAESRMGRSEMGSINFSLSESIGQCDLAFTRLFSRTLGTLSDLSEVAKRAGKSDPASSLTGISGADEREPVDDRQ